LVAVALLEVAAAFFAAGAAGAFFALATGLDGATKASESLSSTTKASDSESDMSGEVVRVRTKV